MATLVLEDIDTLVTCASTDGRKSGAAMGDVGLLRNAQVAIDGDRILYVGKARSRTFPGARVLGCAGRTVLPGFVDSHTHIVHAGDRSDEFARRLRGVTYQEIAAEGGGILRTMGAVRSSTAVEIADASRARIRSAFGHGSTTIEAKSGYGLDLHSELRLLETIDLLHREGPVTLVPTFLGAHDLPPEYRDNRGGYVDVLVREMIPEVARRGLARFCDVFSDTGYFSVDEAETILAAARRHGLAAKVHADELSGAGGAELSARVGAVSADHLLMVSDAGIEDMRTSGVVATLLPGTAFFLNLPYAPARRMIDAGLVVALATDCNPGSNPCENMQITLALACMGMRMTVEEAITASTINGAAALGMEAEIGSIEPGKRADLVVFATASYEKIVYHYGVNHVESVIKEGSIWSVHSELRDGSIV